MPSIIRSVGKNRLITEFNFVVAPGGSSNELIAPLSEFKSVKLYIDIEDTTDNRRVFLNIIANKLQDNSVSDQVYGKINDIISYECNVLINGSDVVLRITNNDSNSLFVNVIQVKNS